MILMVEVVVSEIAEGDIEEGNLLPTGSGRCVPMILSEFADTLRGNGLPKHMSTRQDQRAPWWGTCDGGGGRIETAWRESWSSHDELFAGTKEASRLWVF
jgi:hypothetical protein